MNINTQILSEELRVLASKIELQARSIANGLLLGQGVSKQHGFGFDFDQLRPYSLGDDIRFIDWRASAKTDSSLLVKQYFQERNRIIGVLIDQSLSMSFSTTQRSKAFIAAQAATLLAMIAEKSSDQFFAVGYSGKLEWVLPRARGRQQTRRLLDFLVRRKARSNRTSIRNAVSEAQRIGAAQRMLIFVISDCIEENMSHHLRSLAQRHEVVILRILDEKEHAISDVGYLMLEDFESGETLLIDTRHSASGYDVVSQFVMRQEQEFLRYGFDVSTIYPKAESLEAIGGFLLNRIKK